jgi:hypothetical protein
LDVQLQLGTTRTHTTWQSHQGQAANAHWLLQRNDQFAQLVAVTMAQLGQPAWYNQSTTPFGGRPLVRSSHPRHAVAGRAVQIQQSRPDK